MAGVDTPTEPSVETLIPTFRFMAHRRLRRRAYGQYRKSSSRRWFFTAFIIAVFMSLIGIGAQKLEIATSWPELAIIIVILLVMIYVVVKVSILVRWLVLATLVLFVMNKGDILSTLPTSATQDGLRAKIVLIVLAFLELLTISIVLTNRIVYPRVVLRAKFLNARWWWRIRDVKEPETPLASNYKTVAFSFRLWDSDEYQITRGMVSYTGEFDEQGRPHGLGLWKEGTYTGEALQGIWEHGIPIGPFKSQEYGTGNAFSSIRVGFCKDSSDPDNRTTWNSQRDPKGISYGAATVECSVSGKFFQHLPFVRINAEGIYRSDIVQAAEEDPEAPTTVLSYVMEHLTTYAESLQSKPSIGGTSSANLLKKVAPLSRTIVIRYTDRGLDIPGYIRTSRRSDINEVVIRRVCPPNLGIEGHRLGVSSQSHGEGSNSPSAMNQPILLLPTDPRHHDDSDDSQDERSSTELDSSEIRLSKHDTQESAGHRPQRPMRERRRLWNETGLVVQGWRQVLDAEIHSSTTAFRAGFSALVFIHGYNCSLTYGIARLAQLLSLGEFPPYVKPFVFSWPSSVTLGYFHALKVGCSDAIAKDFRQFIQDLRASGFQRVHILAHSMGARVFLAALRKGALDGILAEREVVSVDEEQQQSDHHSTSGLKPRVSVRYKDSRNGQGHFPDQRVERGYSVESMGSEGEGRPIQLATMTLMNPDADLDIFLDEDYWILSKYCPHITLYADARDGALFWSQLLGQKKSLGRHPRSLVYPPTGEVLDVDVIDTTSLDVNVHSIRHNFFNLNRMLVDDLYDIVVLGRRAREREGRLSNRWTFSDDGVEDGEVFTFLCAPSYVVNA
ncbi:hypothetical protein BGZ73_000446 [Actinomortierella ambigua]|nr:hypothetical protein BGZ73_000446 [Actinomortierella ambigua]